MKLGIYLIMLVLVATMCFALTPKLTYVGYNIRNNSNSQLFNGNYSMSSSIFSTVSGGSALYSQSNNSIKIENGTFAFMFASLSGVDFSNDLWIQANISGQVISPRLEVTPVPQSLYANNSLYWNGRLTTSGIDTFNSTEDMQKAINQSYVNGTNFQSIKCSNIVFTNGIGSAGICDGSDSSGYSSLADLQSAVTNDYHNLGGTDLTGGNSTAEMIRAINSSTGIFGITISTLPPIWNALSNFTTTLNAGKWCAYDGSKINCNVTAVTQTTDTFNSTSDIKSAINNSNVNGSSFIGILCSNIVFSSGIGSAGICDGVDDSGAGGFVYAAYFDQNLNTTSSPKFQKVSANDWTNATIAWSQLTGVPNDPDANNYTKSIQVTGTTTKTLTEERNGMANISTSWTDLDTFNTSGDFSSVFVNRSLWTSIDNYPTACSAGQYVSGLADTLNCSSPPYPDYNNYTKTISFTGTTTKTLTLEQNGMTNISNTFTDIDTFNSTADMRQAINASVSYIFSITGTAVATSDSAWTSHNSYPSDCTPGNVVYGLNDALTCVTDLNNYTKSLQATGTTTKTLTIERNGMANISTSWTDIDSFNSTHDIRTAINASKFTTANNITTTATGAGFCISSGVCIYGNGTAGVMIIE